MRVVGGRLRGRRLTAPTGLRTRPTPDRVREAVFSILGSVEGARVLDLFAGSGALGIEALSRGAARATLVDRAAAAIAAIERNVGELGLAGEAELHRQQALQFLRHARERGRQYDLVFIDPPYRQAEALSRRLSPALVPVLSPGARVVTESDRRVPLQLEIELLDERRYGDTVIRLHRASR